MSSKHRWRSIILFCIIVLIADNKLGNRNHLTIMSSSKRWVVTTSNTNDLKKITKELAHSGFSIDQVLTEIGCVTGTASDEVAKKIRTIRGVTDVSPESNIDIGPPDADITW